MLEATQGVMASKRVERDVGFIMMYCVGFLLIVLALEVEFSCLDLLRFSSDETRTFYIFTIISIYRLRLNGSSTY